MNVLIIGAGAVGQVYGRHLEIGGAQVSFFVRARHVEAYKRGFNFYPLNRPHPRRQPIHMPIAEQQLLTTVEAVAAQVWDQVYVCVSATGLHDETILAALRATGDATVVSLQPSPVEQELIARHVSRDRLVCGMITLISYQAPLQGETVPTPGMAYYVPPFSSSPYSGPETRTTAVIEAMSKGGLRSRRHKNVTAQVGFPSAILMTLLTGLEAANWSFKKLAEGDRLKEVAAAAQEAFAVIGKAQKVSPSAALRLAATSTALRFALAVGPYVLPLPMETYFHAHFTKVRSQTRLHMSEYLHEAKAQGIAADKLAALEAKVAHNPAS